MERTESLVIQVAPSFENQKIAEMEMFGWNLQGRQEIHEAGDAYGAPSFFDSNTYVIKQRVSQYVKLHFVRSLSLPNIDEIKQLELEYFNLPFPAPPSQKWPIGCIAIALVWLLCVGCAAIGMIGMAVTESSSGNGIPDIGQTLLGFIFMIGGNVILSLAALVPGIFWYRSNEKKRKESNLICEQSASKAKDIVAQVKLLL